MLTQLTKHDGEVAVGSFGDYEDVYRGKKSACEAVKRSLRFKPKAKMVLLPMNVVYTVQVLKPAELQNNGYDCGVLIIAVATSIYEKRDLTTELGLVVKEAKDWRRSILIKLANRMREAPLPQTSPHNPATTPPATASPTRRNHPRPSPAKRKEAPANSAVADTRKVQIVEEDAGVPGLEDIKPLTRKKLVMYPEFEDETEIEYLRRLSNLSGEEKKRAQQRRGKVLERRRWAEDSERKRLEVEMDKEDRAAAKQRKVLSEEERPAHRKQRLAKERERVANEKRARDLAEARDSKLREERIDGMRRMNPVTSGQIDQLRASVAGSLTNDPTGSGLVILTQKQPQEIEEIVAKLVKDGIVSVRGKCPFGCNANSNLA
ncbi:hypothetical protein LTR10_002424 [Elasticomyces elasticus]|nr:hypothetical protein LTR10_002424 [Elasticomyces elasticus]KAK4973509.1 hypothetical protein LTR42_005498 [Elasticomyces elasticus]